MAKRSSTKKVVMYGSGYDPSSVAYLPGVKALVTVTLGSADMFTRPDADPINITVNKKETKIIPWGSSNNLPQLILAKVDKSEILSNGLNFNMVAGYGDGPMACYYEYANGTKQVKPYEYLGDDLLAKMVAFPEQKADFQKRYDLWKKTYTAFLEFTENNDLGYYTGETFIDINYLSIAFVEIILNKAFEVVGLMSKEASYCRFEKANNKGIIENVVYSSKWNETKAPKEEDCQIIPILDPRSTIRDLKERTGKITRTDEKVKKTDDVFRYFIPIIMPSPGKNYYPRASWHSVFESGWYDIALSIPKLKKAIMENQMTLKYHIELSEDYFTRIFRDEKITDQDKKQDRVKLEYKNMNDFLSNAENSGKSVVSFIEYLPDNGTKNYLKISAIDNPLKDGEYLEDSEEASNVMNYALGVHPSITGASPGKNKTINGTEARELFLIKQSLMKLPRDYVMKPLYVIKAQNGWDPALQFAIPNIQLTTLDQGKQTEKVVS